MKQEAKLIHVVVTANAAYRRKIRPALPHWPEPPFVVAQKLLEQYGKRYAVQYHEIVCVESVDEYGEAIEDGSGICYFSMRDLSAPTVVGFATVDGIEFEYAPLGIGSVLSK
jgi:hypothetical protein